MEDEYSTVRSNTVQAMCNLSTSCPEFGVESMSHLVDMLNDEIQGVRLLAIRSLRQISEVRRPFLSWLKLNVVISGSGIIDVDKREMFKQSALANL